MTSSTSTSHSSHSHSTAPKARWSTKTITGITLIGLLVIALSIFLIYRSMKSKAAVEGKKVEITQPVYSTPTKDTPARTSIPLNGSTSIEGIAGMTLCFKYNIDVLITDACGNSFFGKASDKHLPLGSSTCNTELKFSNQGTIDGRHTTIDGTLTYWYE